MAKQFLYSLFFISTIISFGQEINTGLNVGLLPYSNRNYYTIGGNFEYRPKHAYFSINTDPFVIFENNRVTFSEPIFLKFIFGKKLKFCPAAGGFVRTTPSHGWLLGLHLEYVMKDKFILFSKNEFYQVYWKDKVFDHFGGTSTSTNHSNHMLFCVGLKIKLKQ